MEDSQEKDSMRLCPTCRMPISVLATRCRHCGVEVARPRREEKQITIRDLGGDKSTNYTVSGNVMDALESFREEQLSAQEQERLQREQASGTWFGRKAAQDRNAAPRSADFPELDENSRELAGLGSVSQVEDLVGSTAPRRTAPRRNLGPTPQERLIQIGAVVVGLIVLYVGATMGWARYQTYKAEQEALLHPDYTSKALDMLAAGRPVVDCLSEAVSAVSHTDSPGNRDALEQARARVVEEVNKLLNSYSYDREVLDQASLLASKAAQVDGDSRIQDLDAAAKSELAAYSLILLSIDVKTQRAKFKIHDRNVQQDEQEVGVGDYVGGRFVVQSIIEGQVRLIDNKRRSATGQRSIIARPASPVSAE